MFPFPLPPFLYPPFCARSARNVRAMPLLSITRQRPQDWSLLLQQISLCCAAQLRFGYSIGAHVGQQLCQRHSLRTLGRHTAQLQSILLPVSEHTHSAQAATSCASCSTRTRRSRSGCCTCCTATSRSSASSSRACRSTRQLRQHGLTPAYGGHRHSTGPLHRTAPPCAYPSIHRSVHRSALPVWTVALTRLSLSRTISVEQ
jgi:hypothetical protein